MQDLKVQRALQHLFQITEAGEKGYATAAINMPDPALKISSNFMRSKDLPSKMKSLPN